MQILTQDFKMNLNGILDKKNNMGETDSLKVSP